MSKAKKQLIGQEEVKQGKLNHSIHFKKPEGYQFFDGL